MSYHSITLFSILVIYSVFAQDTVPDHEFWIQSTGLGSLSRFTCHSGYRGDPYSVRWYKIQDGQELEFYRYERNANPQEQYPVNVTAVKVDENQSGRNNLGLYDMDETTSGIYKCVMLIEDAQPPVTSTYRFTFPTPVETTHAVNILTNSVGPGSSVTLECDVGAPTDQSWHFGFKWYTANNVEIYRYSNWHWQQPEIVFPVPSVNVNVQQSNGSHLTLENLDAQSFGIYKCFSYAETPRVKSPLYKINLRQEAT